MKFEFINTIESFEEQFFSIDPISSDHKHLFDLSELTDGDIDALIDTQIKDKNLDELEDEIENLCGGIVIKRYGSVFVSPNCCGDLSDIYGWENVKTNISGKWTKLWIGHPWIYYKKEKDQILISDYYEEDYPDIQHENIRFAISAEELESNLIKMCEVQEIFQLRLSENFKKRKIKNHKIIAECMACCNRRQ